MEYSSFQMGKWEILQLNCDKLTVIDTLSSKNLLKEDRQMSIPSFPRHILRTNNFNFIFIVFTELFYQLVEFFIFFF